MKHFPMFGSLVAVVMGSFLTAYQGWASGGPLSFSGDLGPDFLMYSAQGYLGVNLSEVDTDRITALHLKDASMFLRTGFRRPSIVRPASACDPAARVSERRRGTRWQSVCRIRSSRTTMSA